MVAPPHGTNVAQKTMGVITLALIAAGQIDIGNARTELLEEVAARNLAADPTAVPPAMMEVADVADALLYMASLPLSANVLNLTVMASKMPFVGRG